ncbi:MAG: hypothetical protein KAH86_04765 [Methanosarcinales archaeon]|nr:hypothetical protein [Methanosarcinales archaeon]
MKDLIEWELKNFNKPGVILALTSAANYNRANVELLRYLIHHKKEPGVYITLNKPYTNVKNVLVEEGIDTRMILFIDAITKPSGGDAVDTGECYYIDDLKNLSDMALVIDEALLAIPFDKKFLFFDTLSTLVLYNNTGSVAQFIHFLSGKIRRWNLDAIFLSLEIESDAELLDRLTQFSDKVLKIEDCAISGV